MLPAEASILSILQIAPDFKTLERELHAAMAAEYRARLTAILTALDTELMAQRPSGLRHGGTKVRTLETRLGPVMICRRRYLQTLPTGERRWRYLLDEALGLPPEVRTSPGVQEHAIETALQVSYRRAATLVARAHPEQKGPGHGTIHRWLSGKGERSNRLGLKSFTAFEPRRSATLNGTVSYPRACLTAWANVCYSGGEVRSL